MALPSLRKTHVCAMPTASARNGPLREKARPSSSFPQQARSPLSVRPQLCSAPAPMAPNSTSAGGVARSFAFHPQQVAAVPLSAHT